MEIDKPTCIARRLISVHNPSVLQAGGGSGGMHPTRPPQPTTTTTPPCTLNPPPVFSSLLHQHRSLSGERREEAMFSGARLTEFCHGKSPRYGFPRASSNPSTVTSHVLFFGGGFPGFPHSHPGTLYLSCDMVSVVVMVFPDQSSCELH